MQEVKDTIDYWTKWANSNNHSNYDIAILKIWIKFENYLGEVFLNYAIGHSSEYGYSPKLKIQFCDEYHFYIFMREGNKKYIEYLNKIETLSEHIFEKNPFDIILKDYDRKNKFEQLKCLRNYIAHESEEAKSKLIKSCFRGKKEDFITPDHFLKSHPKKNREKSYYSIYVDLILEVLEGVNSNIE